MTPSPPIPTAAHAEYRRRARRIRSAFAAAPATRVRALNELAREQDRARGKREAAPVVALPEGSAAGFAELVRQRMDGPILRYSHRTGLIRHAEQRGIGRFEANLIIAAVQHQAGAQRPIAAEAARPTTWATAAVAFAATQSLIGIAVWWAIG